jgi:digeranylgeranylglycerophospholipid reductase
MGTRAFEVVVIGGGPAGSRTAALLAERGHRVLVLEKRDRIGYPVRCAEAVGPREDVERYIELDEALISSVVDGFLVASPNGEHYRKEMPGIGFVIDRELFDQRLAEGAARAGADIRTGHQATGLIFENGFVRGVRIKEIASGDEYGVECKAVVGADGVEAHSPRWAGLKRSFRPEEVFSCAQELVEGVPDWSTHIEFHLGRSFAPGGYAWVFPKGEGRANAGVGINPVMTDGRTARDCLETFLSHRCPHAKRSRFVIGGCSVARGLPALATDGYLAVGEAAHQNNPFSGGGIINALEGADMAAEALLEALERGDTSSRSLDPYTKRWNGSVGRTNTAFYRAARLFYSLGDDEMSRIMKSVISIPGVFDDKGIKPSRMILGIIRAEPSLSLKFIKSCLKR